MIKRLNSKINWKAVIITGLCIGALNYDTEEQYPVAYSLGVGVGFTCIALPYSLIVSKGKGDFQS